MERLRTPTAVSRIQTTPAQMAATLRQKPQYVQQLHGNLSKADQAKKLTPIAQVTESLGKFTFGTTRVRAESIWEVVKELRDGEKQSAAEG